MPTDDAAAASTARPTVFLSYATQDRPAARALQQAMASFDLEVWLDESELGGGEAWDQKIRRQIRECQYFMPVVSAQTEARVEGYFRREWRLAVERSLDMADDHLFLLPVVIDATDQSTARVPEKFLTVQWLKVPGGKATPALEALCRRITAGDTAVEPPARKARSADAARKPAPAAPEFPPFPAATPGQSRAHWVAVLVWSARTLRAAFLRLPRWARVVAYLWMGIALLSRMGESDNTEVQVMPPDKAEKIAAIAEAYKGSANKIDIAKLGEQVAREFAKDAAGQKNPLLAIPFAAPPGDASAAKLADTAFATTYGRIALARHGHVALSDNALASGDLSAAVERGSAEHASYVLYGVVKNPGAGATLDIKIADVDEKSVLWTKSFALAGTDPAKIAAEVEAKVPSLDN